MKPENPYPAIPDSDSMIECLTMRLKNALWYEGFDAAIKYLNEPCTDHPVVSDSYGIPFNNSHFDCPQCREEIGLC